MIYTIGDSHSSFGWSKIDGVACNWLGPKLMYNFNKDYFKLKNISDEDHIIFCFGEIDARCHIKKHIINNSYQEIITNICLNYINQLLEIKKINNIKNIYVYNVLPTRRIETKEPYEITCKTYMVYDEVKAQPFPFIGTDLERKLYTLFFNSELKKITEKNNLGFIDVYDKYIDKDGYLNMNLSDGTLHIDDETHLKEYIKKRFKI
jgi:hypothetical protein